MAPEYEALLQFLYIAPVGLVQTTLDGEVVMLNPVSSSLLMPLAADGNLGNLFTALAGVAPDLGSLVRSFEHSRGPICDAMHLQVNAGVPGVSDPQILSLSLLKLDETWLMAVLSDISAQVKRERLLRHNQAWLDAILTGITDYALVSLDAEGRIDDWNTSIGRVTGFARDDALGRPYSIFYPPGATTPDRLLDRLREADADGWSLDDGWRVRSDGGRFWGSAMITPLRAPEAPGGAPSAGRGTGEPAGYCLVLRDITDKRDAAEVHRLTIACDHLTQIANRRAFFSAAELEIERWTRSPRELSLILFDADNFKAINDRYGHPAGDAVLRHFAELLTHTFRQVDVVARIGGEEFAVLLPSTGAAAAAAVAERLRAALAQRPVEIDGQLIRYTVSGGVATMGDGIESLDALMKGADRALYRAKAAGRDRIESEANVPAPLAPAVV